MNRKHVIRAAAAAVVAAMPSAVFAATYASQLSLSTAGSDNIVNFRLNDSADSVDIIINGTTTMSFAGPFTSGMQSLNVGTTAPSQYQVVVRKNEASGYIATGAVQQIGIEMPFFAPRGVAVNNDPSSPFFGRVYVLNATAGATSAPFPPNYPTGRTVTRGVYAMNADLSDAIGQGDTAKTGGWTFATDAISPTKVEIGPDGNVYIADWSDPGAALVRVDGNVSDGSAINVLTGVGNPPPAGANHADIGAAVITGTTAGGNLQIWGIDSSFGGSGNFQRLYRWDAGSTVPTAVAPVGLANPLINTVSGVTNDLDRNGKTGNFYMMQNRSAGNESGIFVVSPDGARVLWGSLGETRAVFGDPAATDVLKMSRSVKSSPDGTRMVITRDDGTMYVVPLLAGIPDMVNLRPLDSTSFNATRGDAAFDIAGNLYQNANGDEWLRVFSPGGNNVIVTGSNGTATAESLWKGASGGNFNTAGNWLANNTPASASGSWSAASFGESATPTSVNIDGSATVSTVRINSTGSYTLGGGTLTMDGFAPNVVVEKGSHTISAPVQLNMSTGFAALNVSDTLTVSGALTTAGNVNIIKGGAGTVNFTGSQDLSNVQLVGVYDGTLGVGAIQGPGGANQQRVVVAPGATLNATGIHAARLTVNGTVNVATNGGAAGTVIVNHTDAMATAGLSGLAVGTNGKLNLNDNDLLIDYDANGPALETSTRDLVKAGRAPGSARGIYSTPGPSTDDRVLAVADNVDLNKPSWNGITIDASTIIGKYTFFGDANLDGAVTGDDYLAVDAGLGIGTKWIQGDFNLDGAVTGDDYLAVDANLGKGSPTPLAFAEMKEEMVALHVEMFGEGYLAKLADVEANGFGTLVPEPGALSLIGLGALGRRRRNA